MTTLKNVLFGWKSLSREKRLLSFLRDFYVRKSTMFSLGCVLFLLVTSYKPSDPFFLIALGMAFLWCAVNFTMGALMLAAIGERWRLAPPQDGGDSTDR